MKYVLFSGFLVVGFILFFLFSYKSEQTADFFAMDTIVSYKIKGKKDNYIYIIKDCDKIFNAYNADSELYKINHLNERKVSEDMKNIISCTLELSQSYGDSVDITAGAVTELWGISTENPRVPDDEQIKKALSTVDYKKISFDGDTLIMNDGTMLDLGAVAKGYALDKIKEQLDSNKVSYAVYTMGSSSLLYGKKDNSLPFNVEIRNPDGNGSLGTLKTGETFISTSGGYERYFEADGEKYIHIFNMKTGYPSKSDITSVTVLCDSGIKSDFLSTLIFLDGTEGLAKHLYASDYKIIVATKDKKVYCSDGLNFNLNSDSNFSLEVL